MDSAPQVRVVDTSERAVDTLERVQVVSQSRCGRDDVCCDGVYRDVEKTWDLSLILLLKNIPTISHRH